MRFVPCRLGVLVLVLVLMDVARPALARSPEIPSTWNGTVVVDGLADEWTGALVPLSGLPLSLGVRNDGTFLYVCVTTSDEAARKQILAGGLSIRMDASAKESAGFGVRYPVGRMGTDRRDMPYSDDPRRMKELEMVSAGAEIGILGREEGDLGVMRVADANPIEAALGETDGKLVVEVKVPLSFTVESPHAIDTLPGKTISVGLDTSEPKMKRSSRGRRPEDSEGGGSEGGSGSGGRGPGAGFGMGGSHGGHGGMGGSGGRGRGGEGDSGKAHGKPLKVWVTVPLAAAPAPAPAPKS